MNATDTEHPDDATLVAWLDGELPADAARRVAWQVARSTALHDRVRLLRAARAELAWAFAADAATPPPAAPTRRGFHGTAASAVMLLCAAAACAIVVWFAVGARPGHDDAAANQSLELRLVPTQPAFDLFAPVGFQLIGTAKTAMPVRIVARKPKETDAELADRVFADAANHVVLPVVVDAEVISPDGSRRQGSMVRLQPTFTTTTAAIAFDLVDVQCSHPGISPVVAVRFTPAGPAEDFRWPLQRIGEAGLAGVSGFVPEDVGGHRLSITLRSFTPLGDSRWPPFEALTVTAGFQMRGVVGAWSEPVDGLRARLVAATGATAPGRPLALALQLRNDSGRARAYNVIGVTLAPIPQPFHFDLLVDDQPLRQRDDVALTMSGSGNFLAQPPDTLRSVVFSSAYWRTSDARPLQGKRSFAARFHFAPTTWAGGDALWQGTVQTPAIAVDCGRH